MDVPEAPGLGGNRLALTRLSAALAARDPEKLVEAMAAAGRVDPSAVEEVILQSYLFLGYPIALNAFALWRDVSGTAATSGIPDDWEAWVDRGEGVCRIVYGGAYNNLRRNVKDLHPDMERWMVVEGYGKVLGRPQLDLKTRELCIIALLAVLGAPRQLYSHLRGAMNAGAEPSEVEETLEAAREYLDVPGWNEAQEVWCHLRARPNGTGSPPSA